MDFKQVRGCQTVWVGLQKIQSPRSSALILTSSYFLGSFLWISESELKEFPTNQLNSAVDDGESLDAIPLWKMFIFLDFPSSFSPFFLEMSLFCFPSLSKMQTIWFLPSFHRVPCQNKRGTKWDLPFFQEGKGIREDEEPGCALSFQPRRKTSHPTTKSGGWWKRDRKNGKRKEEGKGLASTSPTLLQVLP